MARKMKTMDGNTAAAWVSYAFTEVAAIYPITPSSVMAEVTDQWSAEGKKNIFGQNVKVVEMQSEGGAAGAVHGSLAVGALTTTYTASQGLLLMVPNMFKMAGELLPGVIHVSARALASHALSIFGDHSDVYACRQTGFAMLASTNPQEVMDLGAIAHLSSIKGRLPFLHFFDGFRTSHEISKIEAWDYETLKDLVDMEAVDKFRKNALNPDHPVLRGSAQNPDIFFQARESCNKFYNQLPTVVEEYMNRVNEITGKDYKLFNYYGAPDADKIIIAMGSVCDTIEETIDYLNASGQKVGLLKVRLYRPFSVSHMLSEIPTSVKSIAVLDRTKEPGAVGEPLYQDVCSAYAGKANAPLIVGGRYGLGSKDTTPAQIIAVYENLKEAEPKNNFTIGIVDDVTHCSLEATTKPDTTPSGTISCKFWGLGSDGTVGANKNSIKIIGDHTDKYAQAYFAYDSKKSGGVTVSHLRFGDKPIKSTYLIDNADFVACHNPSYIDKYDILSDLKKGGTFLLNCQWSEQELANKLPGNVKRYIAQNDIKFYIVDGTDIARELGLGNRINMILQAAFFKLSKIIDIDEAVGYMKEAIVKTYGSKGESIVSMNQAAVDRGLSSVVQVNVPAQWAECEDSEEELPEDLPEFVKEILIPVNKQKGDSLPVSTFCKREDGTLEQGSSAYEKRGIAVDVPKWIPENCIQCNQCAYFCPHATIRPVVMDAQELQKAPEGMPVIKMSGKGCEQYSYGVIVSALDCTGCGVCAKACLSKNKALEMKPIESQLKSQDYYDYGVSLPDKELPVSETTVKGSQFKKPLLEYSGACAGCGETPYAKLITQLYGDRMLISNATGCSSIWGGSAPSTPYTKNFMGRGPAWANSLFEDNAEHGYGMYVATKQIRDRLVDRAQEMLKLDLDQSIKTALENWLETLNDGKKSLEASDQLVDVLSKATLNGVAKDIADDIVNNKEHLFKKSVWILGGDGWAYDIGFGGLDHVLASGDNVNVLVFDTEVYSNTGGQSSKATQLGAVAQFAASGKKTRKKDLAGMAMSYGYVYVAQISMGANQSQCIKAISEAESYDGPSLIIAYSPCIAHGIKGGMTNAQTEAKKAEASGYWTNFRYDPRREEQGENPFQLDSKAPTGDAREFMMSQVRYNSLFRKFPDQAEQLMTTHEKQLDEKFKALDKKAKQ